MQVNSLQDDRLYTLGHKGEIRQFIPISSSTQWRWEREGRLEVIRIGSRRFVRGSTIRKLMEGSSESDK